MAASREPQSARKARMAKFVPTIDNFPIEASASPSRDARLQVEAGIVFGPRMGGVIISKVRVLLSTSRAKAFACEMSKRLSKG